MDEIIVGDIVEILETETNPKVWWGKLARVVNINGSHYLQGGRLLSIEFDGDSGHYGISEKDVMKRLPKPKPEGILTTPKDGDHISLHKDHEIVPLSTGGVDYQYCRNCKVEVVDDPTSASQVEWVALQPPYLQNLHPDSAIGEELDKIGTLYGLERVDIWHPFFAKSFPESDDSLRRRIKDCLDIK